MKFAVHNYAIENSGTQNSLGWKPDKVQPTNSAKPKLKRYQLYSRMIN